MISSTALSPSIPGSSRSIVSRSGVRRGSAASASSAVVATASTLISPSYSSVRRSAAAYTPESSQTSTRSGVTPSPTDQPLDRREHGLLVEALFRHVSVRPCFEALAPVVLGSEGGDDHDWQRRACRMRANGPRELNPVQLRHLEVSDHERDLRISVERTESVNSVVRGDDRVAGRLKNAALQLADSERVFDHEDLRSHGLASSRFRPGRQTVAPGLAGERRRLDDEGDPAVPQDGRTQVSGHASQERSEWLDPDLRL